MKKLKLKLEDIKIESFEIIPDKFKNSGTVRGYSLPVKTCFTEEINRECESFLDESCDTCWQQTCPYCNTEGCTEGYSCYCEIPPNTFEDHETCQTQ